MGEVVGVSGFKQWGVLTLLIGCLLAWNQPVSAEPRVALVIGNSAYGASFSSLTNCSNATGSEFDDIVTWIGTSPLFNRMIGAGQLP